MRLIIDIPEESYNILKNGYFICPGVRSGKTILQQFCRAIYNGTPLPKGHGRLIDAREYESSIRKHYFDNATVIRCTEIALGNAPAIIKADKETDNVK